ncbi:MAG: hypothetical protein ACRDCF_00120 [Mycoplasmoidaceae bacterium]
MKKDDKKIIDFYDEINDYIWLYNDNVYRINRSSHNFTKRKEEKEEKFNKLLERIKTLEEETGLKNKYKITPFNGYGFIKHCRISINKKKLMNLAKEDTKEERKHLKDLIAFQTRINEYIWEFNNYRNKANKNSDPSMLKSIENKYALFIDKKEALEKETGFKFNSIYSSEYDGFVQHINTLEYSRKNKKVLNIIKNKLKK